MAPAVDYRLPDMITEYPGQGGEGKERERRRRLNIDRFLGLGFRIHWASGRGESGAGRLIIDF